MPSPRVCNIFKVAPLLPFFCTKTPTVQKLGGEESELGTHELKPEIDNTEIDLLPNSENEIAVLGHFGCQGCMGKILQFS